MATFQGSGGHKIDRQTSLLKPFKKLLQKPKGCSVWYCSEGGGLHAARAWGFSVGLTDILTACPVFPDSFAGCPLPYPAELCSASEGLYFSLSLKCYSWKVKKRGYFPNFPAALFLFIECSTAGPLSRKLQEPFSSLLVVKGVTR